MSTISHHHARPPRRAGDPLNGPLDALDVVLAAIDDPPSEQVVCLLLDDARAGFAVVMVDAARDDDAVLELADLLASSHPGRGPLAAVVLASVRPTRAAAIDPLDACRWESLQVIFQEVGIELADWFLLGRDEIVSMAEHRGEAWPVPW